MREADRKLGGGILAAQYIMHAYLHALFVGCASRYIIYAVNTFQLWLETLV